MSQKLKLGVVALATATILASSIAFAAIQNFNANVRFATPLTLTKVKDLDFGIVQAFQAGTYVLSATGVVTASGGGVAVGGTPQAGELTIAGSATQTINISTNGLAANNGVTPSVPTCRYNGGTETTCNLTNQVSPGAGKTLFLGLTVVVNGSQADGTTASPSFNVNVVYN